jgi:hypothetical protein
MSKLLLIFKGGLLVIGLLTAIVLGESSAVASSRNATHWRGIKLSNEKRLIDDLFKNYQVRFGRPVNNMTEKVIIYFGIFLIQLIDLVTLLQV